VALGADHGLQRPILLSRSTAPRAENLGAGAAARKREVLNALS
jgi:hypothetical protein